MRKFRNDETWKILEEDFQTQNITSFKIRSNGPAIVYEVRENSQTYPVGFCDKEEIEISFPASVYPRIFKLKQSQKTDTWFSAKPLPVLHPRTVTEKFTTFDRPAPLSPEMMAIHRMSKQNEILREKTYNEMETRERTLLDKVDSLSQKLANKNAPPTGQNRTGSRTDATERSGDGSAGNPPEPSVRLSDPPASRSSGPSSDEGSSKTKNTSDSDSEQL